MSTTVAAPASTPAPLPLFRPPEPALWQAPLVPVALAATAGVVLDRYLLIPMIVSLVAVVACLASWGATRTGQKPGLPLIYLAGAVLFVAAAYHHWFTQVFPPDDIGSMARNNFGLARLRGVLVEEPMIDPQPRGDPLRTFAREDTTRTVLAVHAIRSEDDWQPVSGRVRVVITGQLSDIHLGDEIEASGRLSAPTGPANPGELDYEGFLRDKRIRADLRVLKTPEAVRLIEVGWPKSPTGWLAAVRGWGQRKIQEALPPSESGVAEALLLGESTTMTRADWDKYIRTGVIHVLVISGQHLVVLGAFLWIVLRIAGVRRRQGAIFVALFLLAYALMTGGRPPAMRSAVMVCAACLALLLRRPVLAANTFALSWLAVMILSPTDLFDIGCQLSFLAVAVLVWGLGRWRAQEPEPLEKLIEESRPAWQKGLLTLGRWIAWTYGMTLIVSIAVAPLVAERYHTVSPIGILILPPTTLLGSIALVSGFLLLLSAAVCPPAVPLFAGPTVRRETGKEL